MHVIPRTLLAALLAVFLLLVTGPALAGATSNQEGAEPSAADKPPGPTEEEPEPDCD